MSVEVGIWDRLSRLVLLLCCVAGALGLGLWYLPLIRQNERMQQEKYRLEVEVRKEEEAARQMQETLQQLSTDPKSVERLARERLAYARPGETVVRFEPFLTNHNHPARP